MMHLVNGRLVVDGVNPNPKIEFSRDWLPREFKGVAETTALYLSDGLPYYVYIAELYDDVYYALVLHPAAGQTSDDVLHQRHAVLASHLRFADFLHTTTRRSSR